MGPELWGGRPPWQEEINPSASGRQLPYRPFREKLRQAGAGRLDRRALRISTAAPPSTSGVCSPPWRPTRLSLPAAWDAPLRRGPTSEEYLYLLVQRKVAH